MAAKKKTATKLYIQVDGTDYPVKLITKATVMKLVNEFKIGKFKVYQDGKPVLPSLLKKNLPVKIVRQDRAG